MALRGNEEAGIADGKQAGEEQPNDTLTFELETNESIVIKLFICLFTMKNRERGRGGRAKVSKTS